MKKLVFAMALVGAVAFSSNAWAQCCDAADLDNDGTAETSCVAVPGNLPDTPTAGCAQADSDGTACIGGNLAGEAGPEGCVCLLGSCVSDTASAPNSLEDCTASAAASCDAAGATN